MSSTDTASGVITTHCVSNVIHPGRITGDPLRFVKIQTPDLSKKVIVSHDTFASLCLVFSFPLDSLRLSIGGLVYEKSFIHVPPFDQSLPWLNVFQ